MEIINRFPPNLTADAKAKRLGFHLVRGTDNAEEAPTGVAVEGVRTGTYQSGGYTDEDGVVFPAASAVVPKATALLPAAPRSSGSVANVTVTSQNLSSKVGEANILPNPSQASLYSDEENPSFPANW